MRGEFYRLPARGKGHKQRGRRFAVVLQPDWLNLSTWIVAFTSTTARETSFRPPVTIVDQRTLVMCDQLATVDLDRLTEPVGFLAAQELRRVDEALALILDTCSRAARKPLPPPNHRTGSAPHETNRLRRRQSASANPRFRKSVRVSQAGSICEEPGACRCECGPDRSRQRLT